MKGLFITFEGPDGCGKSLQSRKLVEWLKATRPDLRVELTFEPGATDLGRQVRAIVNSSRRNGLVPEAELLLFAADRAQHVAEQVRPWLEAGAVVISDRYADSTLAYQGYGRGLDLETVQQVMEVATLGVWPDLTLLLDLEPAIALARLDRGALDRIEQETLDFHRRVRQGFLELAHRAPQRFKVLEAALAPEAVFEQVKRHVQRLLEGKGES